MKFYIGVEIGVRNIAIGIIDKNQKLVRKVSTPTDKDKSFEGVIKDIYELIEKAIDEEGLELKQIKSIGVGCPGITDNDKGIVLRNYSLNFENANIRHELQKYINVPVYVENDANCVAISEYLLGAAYGTSSSLTIKIGNGIGGGLIIDGSIYNGFNFGGTEFGHMVINQNGRQCTCGRKGCWEMYASASALIEETKKVTAENPDSIIMSLVNNDINQINETTAYEAAKQGDIYAKKVFDDFIEVLAEGIANIVNILMPSVVIIAGPINKLGESLSKPLISLLSQKIYCKGLKLPEFKMAETGGGAIILGAAMLGNFKDDKIEML